MQDIRVGILDGTRSNISRYTTILTPLHFRRWTESGDYRSKCTGCCNCGIANATERAVSLNYSHTPVHIWCIFNQASGCGQIHRRFTCRYADIWWIDNVYIYTRMYIHVYMAYLGGDQRERLPNLEFVGFMHWLRMTFGYEKT